MSSFSMITFVVLGLAGVVVAVSIARRRQTADQPPPRWARDLTLVVAGGEGMILITRVLELAIVGSGGASRWVEAGLAGAMVLALAFAAHDFRIRNEEHARGS